MATSTLGSLEPFDTTKEDWSAYTERFDQFILANDIQGEKKIVATFLPIVGSKTYNLLRDLLAPTKPSSRKYKELVEVLAKHYDPKPLVIAERFHFHKRDQNEGQSVAEFSAALKKASERCEFNAFLEEALRDRFVCGLRSKNIQKKLLAEKDLTWKRACEVAQAMESAERQANKFTSGIQGMNALKSRPARGQAGQRQRKEQGKPCFRCGAQHSPQTCRFKNEQCHNCKNIGHISKVCRKPKTEEKKRSSTEKPRNSTGFRYLGSEQTSEDEREMGELFKVGDGKSEPSIVISV